MKTCKTWMMIGMIFFLCSDMSRATEHHSEENQAEFEHAMKVRDPFRPPSLENADGASNELEAYPSDQFKMLGMITGPKQRRAMLLSPSGKTFIVTEKVRIGKKKGHIRKILTDRMMIVEKVLNVFGKEEDSEVILRLPSDSKISYGFK